MKKFTLSLVLLVSSIGAVAESERVFEAGLNVGTPAGINIALGQWGTEEMPLLTRVTGGFWGRDLKGLQLDIGYSFDLDGNFKQYVALSGVVSYLRNRKTLETVDVLGAGPSYGFNLYGFSLQAGLIAGAIKVTEVSLLGGTSETKPPVSLIVQLGYSVLF